MKLLSFRRDGRESYGVLAGAGVIDLGRRLGPDLPDLRSLLAADGLGRAAEAAARLAADHALAGVHLLKPIPTPGAFICVGVNYRDRTEEYKDGSDLPRHPSLFFRTPGSLVAHGEPIVRPPESEQLDYEGEIALIIGRGGRRIPEERAMDHVAGFSCVNEGTIRDWTRHGKFNVTQGKNFERSGSFGPWLVTADEIGGRSLTLTTRVNGEQRQRDTTDRLLFSFPALIRYISTFCELHPGDVITTGTPTGAGVRFNPPRYLRPGDVVEVEVSGVGVLRNEVIEEPR